MTANARWQDVSASNLASSSVPGFKRQDVAFSTLAAEAMNKSQASHLGLPKANAVTSFNQGEMRSTGVPTDMALEGKGFFTVRLPDGTEGYTRDGEFHINGNGELVTKQGYAVLGDGGPIQLDRNNPAPLTIGETGEIRQGNELKGTLQITDFNDTNLLTASGGGFFVARDPNLQPMEMDTPQIRQGVLENSNTSAVLEMTGLISSMRAFEANQKVIQMHDERMGKAIQEIANPN